MQFGRKHILGIMAGVIMFALAGGAFFIKDALDALASSPTASRTTEPPRAAAAAKPATVPSPQASPSPSAAVTASPSSAKPSPTGPPPGPRPCRYEGKAASQSQVKAALEAAAAKRFWQNSATIYLPVDLIKAVAKHESGWQSNAVSCDDAFGVMQVIAGTAEMMNNRFAITPPYDRKTLTGNTMLGSAYLQWLIKEMGDKHFGGNYVIKPCATAATKCLLNAVISAYQVGHQAVHDEIRDGDSTLYPNPDYVANVRYWMARY